MYKNITYYKDTIKINNIFIIYKYLLTITFINEIWNN